MNVEALLAAGRAPRSRGAPPPRPASSRVEAQVGYFDMAATNSAEALFGSSGGVTFGGAVRYAVLARGLRLGRAAHVLEGRRARLPAGARRPVQKLGFPLRSSFSRSLLMAGYRFRDGKLDRPLRGHRRRDHVLQGGEHGGRRELRRATGSKTGFRRRGRRRGRPRPLPRRRRGRLLDRPRRRRPGRRLEDLRRRRHRRLPRHRQGRGRVRLGGKPKPATEAEAGHAEP